MVTYETLFLFGSLVVAIIAFVVDITKKEITAPRQNDMHPKS